MIIKLCWPVPVVFAVACASTPKTEADIPSRRTTVVAIPEMRAIYTDGPSAVESLFNKPAEDVLLAIRKTFVELEIPITVDDPRLHLIGNNDFNRAYRLGAQPMATFVDCGETANGSRASTHRIYMSFISAVESVSNRSSKVKFTLAANARDMAGSNSNNRIPCGSTGRLEQQMLDSVRVKLGG